VVVPAAGRVGDPLEQRPDAAVADRPLEREHAARRERGRDGTADRRRFGRVLGLGLLGGEDPDGPCSHGPREAST
jgi:hypothetical protein